MQIGSFSYCFREKWAGRALKNFLFSRKWTSEKTFYSENRSLGATVFKSCNSGHHDGVSATDARDLEWMSSRVISKTFTSFLQAVRSVK